LFTAPPLTLQKGGKIPRRARMLQGTITAGEMEYLVKRELMVHLLCNEMENMKRRHSAIRETPK